MRVEGEQETVAQGGSTEQVQPQQSCAAQAGDTGHRSENAVHNIVSIAQCNAVQAGNTHSTEVVVPAREAILA